MQKFNYSIPNILISGGATKIKGYLQFLSEFCDDLDFKPKILCLFDYDAEGKKEFDVINEAINKNKYNKFDLKIKFIPRCDFSSERSVDYEVEDFVYPDILREAANKFLKKRDYLPLKSEDIKDRFQAAYNKNCILRLFSEKTKANNPKKSEINFEDSNKGVKKIICNNFCKILNHKNIDSSDKKYPKVKEFIETISDGNLF